jgi:Putative zincin peptidase
MPSIDELTPPDYALVHELTHASLGEFVLEYFFRRGSWVTRAHHLMSAVTLVAIVLIALAQGRSFGLCMRDFGLALATLFVVILPLHELLHAAAYRLAGARDIRWDWSAWMMAVWVIAHRFVVETRAFLVVALAPFVVLNALLIAAAIAYPRLAVYFLCVLLWHLHGSMGDWSLLNFVWFHRARGFWTFDDAEAGKSYFYGRAEG